MGFGVNYEKVEESTTEFLDIVDRPNEIMSELSSWRYRKWCIECQLLSIIGKLIIVSKVVKLGPTFVRRMIDLSKHVNHLHNQIRLNTEFRMLNGGFTTCPSGMVLV